MDEGRRAPAGVGSQPVLPLALVEIASCDSGERRRDDLIVTAVRTVQIGTAPAAG
jgi:hypothetical protein